MASHETVADQAPDIFAEIDAALTPEERAAERAAAAHLADPAPRTQAERSARDGYPPMPGTVPDRYAALAAKMRGEAAYWQAEAAEMAHHPELARGEDRAVVRAATFLACAQMLEHVHGGAR